ncbi:DUF4192 domain-containing protein [Streptomyces mexicanus]|uniref:DUF4192 domain-containing protein n=1 Tax=Streptomyces mexicanus TaxID=178566 RepID=UPI001F3723E6|nr:DUF4192 domain-containing protein [Streptomyces mexicanus]
MTNHSHTTGPLGSGHITYAGPGPEHQVTLRTPAELADALPYLLGYRPEDSIVLVALHDRGGRGRFGGRARLGIPSNRRDWPSAARQLAHGLITGSERRGAKPEQMVAFLCQEPAAGETAREVMQRLRPLAQKLRTECGRLDVPVIEALCISAGRFWSYCCPTEGCCPDEGRPMGLPGTSVLAAAAAYAGIQVRGSLRELQARLLPWETAAARQQESALDAAGRALVPRMLNETHREAVAVETLELAEGVMRRFAEAPAVPGVAAADLRDDRMLEDEEAARLILGLQDRTTRDRAAEWMEGEEAGWALRLWRALARRCVGPYGEHAAAPLTLVGWVAWSTGDELEAREALAMALGADPDYLFARLLHQACNEGLDPESVRRCLRAARAERTRPPGAETAGTTGMSGSAVPVEPAEAAEAAETAPGRTAAGTASSQEATDAAIREAAEASHHAPAVSEADGDGGEDDADASHHASAVSEADDDGGEDDADASHHAPAVSEADGDASEDDAGEHDAGEGDAGEDGESGDADRSHHRKAHESGAEESSGGGQSRTAAAAADARPRASGDRSDRPDSADRSDRGDCADRTDGPDRSDREDCADRPACADPADDAGRGAGGAGAVARRRRRARADGPRPGVPGPEGTRPASRADGVRPAAPVTPGKPGRARPRVEPKAGARHRGTGRPGPTARSAEPEERT